MADLPELSESTTRKLAVQWDTIREQQKLTEKDLARYDRERRRLLDGSVKQRTGEYPPKERARLLGLRPSVRAAEARFPQFDHEYWTLWYSGGFSYEVYRDWLDTITRNIVAELESPWKGHSPATDRWFEQTCTPAIEKKLEILVEERIAQARDVESRGLSSLPENGFGGPWVTAWRRGAEARKRAAEGLSKGNPNGATEPKPDESSGKDSGPAVNGSKRTEPTDIESTNADLAQPAIEVPIKGPKRGRPQEIPDRRKVEAAALKASGGTNKQAAAKLYDTRFPSPQQVKNVPAILKHHRQKSNQSVSSASARKTALKPLNTKG
jgi:hypothetical protein